MNFCQWWHHTSYWVVFKIVLILLFIHDSSRDQFSSVSSFFFSVTFRKEVGLTKFIPKAVLENMKVSLCNKCVHVQAVFVYPVVMKLKVNYCQNQKIFFLGCFYMWLHVSTHLQGMLSNTNCGTLSFVRTVLSHACDWSA